MPKNLQPNSPVKMPNVNNLASHAITSGNRLKQVVSTTLETEDKEVPADKTPKKYWIRKDDIHRTFLDEVFGEPPGPPQLAEIWGSGGYLITPLNEAGDEDRTQERKIMVGGMTRQQIPSLNPIIQQAPTMQTPPSPPPTNGTSDFMQIMMANKAIEEERRAREVEEKRRDEERRKIEREEEIKREQARELAKKEEERDREEKRKEEERLKDEKRKEEERIRDEKRKDDERVKEEKRKEEERLREAKREEEELKHRREMELKKIELESKKLEEDRRREEEKKNEERRREEREEAARKAREEREEQWRKELQLRKEEREAEDRRREEDRRRDREAKEESERKERLRLEELRLQREESERKETRRLEEMRMQREEQDRKDRLAREEQWRMQEEMRRKEEREREELRRKEEREREEIRREEAKEREERRLEESRRYADEQRRYAEEQKRLIEQQATSRTETLKIITGTATTLLPVIMDKFRSEPPPPPYIPPPPPDNTPYILDAIRSIKDDRRAPVRGVFDDDEEEYEQESRGTSSVEEAMSILKLGMELGKGNEEKEEKGGLLEKMISAAPMVAQALGALKLGQQAPAPPQAPPRPQMPPPRAPRPQQQMQQMPQPQQMQQQQAPAPQQQITTPENMNGRHYSEAEVEQIFSGTMDAVFSDADAMRAQILSNPSKYGPAVMKLVSEHGMELMNIMQGSTPQEQEPPQDDENVFGTPSEGQQEQ